MVDDPMDKIRHALRVILADMLERKKARSLSDWCAQAGLPESTLRMFLAGRTASLTVATVASLARAANRPMSELLGEAPVSSEAARHIQAAE